MSIDKRVTEIKIALNEYKDIFQDPERAINSMKKVGNIIYFPHEISHQRAEGMLLKDKVGYLSFFEIYNLKEKKVEGYTYIFSSDEYDYLLEHKPSNKMSDDCLYFNFHYQNDEQHEPHVSSIHSGVRYISRSIDLKEFLSFVKLTFFKNNGDRTNSMLWDSRFNPN